MHINIAIKNRNVEKKRRRNRCRNKGYCRFGMNCNFYHTEKEREIFIKANEMIRMK